MENINSRINSESKLVLASWNIHGDINNSANLEQMRNDLKFKKVDIGCLQETYHDEEVYSSELNGHLIFVRGKDEAAHHNYGQGFYISNKWYNNLLDIQYISNRISVIQFFLNDLDKTNILTIINVYAPTSLISQKSPEKLQYFYEQLEQSYLFYKARSSLIFLCGDFNSKLGKEKGNELFMGHYGKGSRNKNGEQFAQFLLQHHLYCANTHFTQSIRHISTWHGWIKHGEILNINDMHEKIINKQKCNKFHNQKDKEKIEKGFIKIHNQIDYIIIPYFLRKMLLSSKCYHGHGHASDHGIVITRIKLKNYYCCVNKNNKNNKSYKLLDLPSLQKEDIKKSYQEQIKLKLDKLNNDVVNNKNDTEYDINFFGYNLRKILHQVSQKILPIKQLYKNGKILFTDNKKLTNLSLQQKQLRLQIIETKNHDIAKKVRKKRNIILLNIKKELKLAYKKWINVMCKEIEINKKNNNKFYKIIEK